MTNNLILALDQGTTSSRSILFNSEGQIVRSHQKEFKQIFPKPGWVEHDPGEIWESQLETARKVLEGLPPTTGISGIGITNQRETTLLWDKKTGIPVCNAIVWQDRRTAEYCDELKAGRWSDIIQDSTGLVIDAYFSATKLRWILRNIDGAMEQARSGNLAFGTIDSWLIWNLTGGRLHITDVTNASRTMLYNIRDLKWDDELLDLFEVPRAVLPEVRSSSEVYAKTDPGLFGQEIPIAGIAGDQQAATFGQMCLEKGSVKNTYGTGCFMLCNTGSTPVKSDNKLLSTIAWQINGKTSYALEGSIFTGGAVVQWLRDELGIIKTSAEVEELALKVKDNGGVFFVPALTGLGAPHWDQYARGTITGLTRGSGAPHIARAALESIAYQTHDVLKAMEADLGSPVKELKVDGGAVVNDFLMQFQADILGVPVYRPRILETTALGAAYLAGLATGYWRSTEDIREQWAIDREFKRELSPEDTEKLLHSWHRALERSMKWEESNSG